MSGLALLQSISVLQNRLELLDREYDRVCTEANKATTDLSRPMVQADAKTDRKYDRLIQLSIKRDKTWDELIQSRDTCLRILELMSDPSQAYVLERWYLDNDKKKIEDIADEVPVGRSQAYNWLRLAEKEFDILYAESIDPEVVSYKTRKVRTESDEIGQNRTESDGIGRDLSKKACYN